MNPTAEDLRNSYDAIRLQGPASDEALALWLLTGEDPTLKEMTAVMVLDIAAVFRPLNNRESAMLVGLVDGAVTAGLHLWLEIDEARRGTRAPRRRRFEVFAWLGKAHQDGALKLERRGAPVATYPLVAGCAQDGQIRGKHGG